MIFLIEYNRSEGQIIALTSFEDSERDTAEEARLNLELALHARGVGNEIVLLEAASEEAVRRTHRRYFENLHELTSVPTH
jgi:hypothetical protein